MWLLIVYLLIITVPTFAFAHADVVKSTPAEKEILNTVPAVVSVEFGEAIEPSSFTSLMITDEQGNRVDLENTSIDLENPKLPTVGLPRFSSSCLPTIKRKGTMIKDGPYIGRQFDGLPLG